MNDEERDAIWHILTTDEKALAWVKEAIATVGFDPEADKTIFLFRFALGIGAYIQKTGEVPLP